MADSIDLVMWARNGAWCLRPVLSRINKVIPKKCVNQKIMINDGSHDETADLGQEAGWDVHTTDGLGVGRAAQLALSKVESEYYCSFEQDVLLHLSWFEKLFPHIVQDHQLAVIQGLRASSLKPMRVMEEWRWRRLKAPVSVDNNIYRTKVIKKVGGYPPQFFAGVDTGLYHKILDDGYRWEVDRSVVSLHYRKSLVSDISRLYRYHIQGKGEAWKRDNSSLGAYAKKFLLSPFRGLIVALEMKYPPIALLYPIIRYYGYKGIIDSFRLEAKN